jgi:hypothetical protein
MSPWMGSTWGYLDELNDAKKVCRVSHVKVDSQLYRDKESQVVVVRGMESSFLRESEESRWIHVQAILDSISDKEV